MPVALSINLLNYISQIYSAEPPKQQDQEQTFFNQTLIFFMILIVKDLPIFLTSCAINPDWMEYSAYFIICNVFHYFLYFPLMIERLHFSSRLFIYYSLIELSILIILFSLFEKIRKEIFVIGLTNSKAKKQMMRVFNQIQPTVIVSKEGNIQMCNEKFEQLLSDQVGIKQLPTNIFKLVQTDSKAKNKLVEIIQSTATKTFNSSTKEFELVLKKEPSSAQKKKTLVNSVDSNANAVEPEDISSNIKSQTSESFLEKISAFKITVSSLQFKS